jgi:hypothetical protein
MGIAAYPGTYLHGVNLSDWYPCWNLSLSGYLTSPDFAAATDVGLGSAHSSIRDAAIADLRAGAIPPAVLSPRAMWYVWGAAIVRAGGVVGFGHPNMTPLPQTDMDRMVRLGDIELDFEESRRDLLPEGASRLCSLYAADNSATGRAHIRAMLGDVLPLRVDIPAALRVTRADTTWFEMYCQDAKPEYLERYWQSVPCEESDPKWEYLVDGVIRVIDEDGLQQVRERGARLPVVGDA